MFGSVRMADITIGTAPGEDVTELELAGQAAGRYSSVYR